ncbi:MAG TPA: alpha-hydroxy acid oxidase [Beijerinckiaceae bacterium]|jgi:4-hydroxymandelate oxidase|nr:alpha-hydroxy acid oxidase [Beijerinckiaceae bacterium]
MNVPLPKLQQIPHVVASVHDYEPLARERMTAAAWAYLSGGAADEETMRANEAAFARFKLQPQVLQDLRGGHTQVSLFGQTYPSPLFLAPVAFQKLAHEHGELETVLGASAMQVGMIVSTQASVTLEEIAAQAATPLWFQLYLQADRDFTARLIQRAENAGYKAIVLTVDAPLSGIRNREQRSGFSLPPGVSAVNLHGMRLPSMPSVDPSGPLVFGSPLLDTAARWNDIAWIKERTSLPVLLKGILTAADAERALGHGADGIIVSNHGGRVLDGLPATIDVLESIAAVVGGRVPVLMDGGIRRGSDIFKALALGAQAVLVGRPFAWGLAAAGAVGVSHVAKLLRMELEVTMALMGCRDLVSITRAHLSN